MPDLSSPYTFAPGYTLAGKSILALDVTLVGGTKTQASGSDLSQAIIIGVRLKTATTAVGSPVATISGNDVIVSSYAANASAAATDASTYTVTLAGVN